MNSPSGVLAPRICVGTAQATKCSRISLTLSSVQVRADRPSRAAFQHPADGAPSLPAQMNSGLPSAAAF